MKKIFIKIPAHVRFTVMVYLLGMFVFSLLRILLFVLNYGTNNIPLPIIFTSFYRGLGFDTVIAGYILIIPLFSYFIASLVGKENVWLDRIVFTYTCLLFSISFFIGCADFPWYVHEQTRLSMAALQWTDSPYIMLGIMFGDKSHYPYLFLYILLTACFYFGMKKIRVVAYADQPVIKSSVSIPVYILVIFILMIGIRGRIGSKSPIRWGTAFFSKYNLTNQLTLNPVFTLIDSFLENRHNAGKSKKWMDDKEAFRIIKTSFTNANDTVYSPVARQVVYHSSHHYNIILVIMESMTAYNMAAFGNTNHLTPVLDSLFHQSFAFTNFYSDGIHTNCGVYSCLFGIPSLPAVHHMKDLSNQQKYQGLATTLLKNNYNTLFFTSHDDQFDNMGGFLFPNGFNHIISQKDYPDREVVGPLGIPDHILFKKVLENLHVLNSVRQPFFTAILTSSNHGPYVVPEDIPFRAQKADIKQQAIEYADWSIGKFLMDCKKEAWYDSTIFLFTGDHGAPLENNDRYVTYHHVPFIIYAPALVKPEISDNVGGQVDIYATVMGLLNLSYLNNSFGIDLLHEKRQFVTFTYDEEVGAFSKDNYFVLQQGQSRLFNLEDGKESYRKSLCDSMERYTRAVMQTTQWMIRNRKMY
jgi:phosphoglycerol transferase MdoB-like AlkP superfamily enzyme